MAPKTEFTISGPRGLRDPRSREYAIQTMQALKSLLEGKTFFAAHVDKELQRIIEFRHWEVCGFSTLDTYLKAETGVSFKQLKSRLAQDLAAENGVAAAQPETHAGPGRGKKTVTIGDRLSKGQNTATRIVARLKRDRPDLAERLARGEFKSARAAAREAGWVTDLSALDKIKKLLPKLTAAERAHLLEFIRTTTIENPDDHRHG